MSDTESSTTAVQKIVTTKVVKAIAGDVKVSSVAVTELNKHLAEVLSSLGEKVVENLGKKKTINFDVLERSLDSDFDASSGTAAVKAYTDLVSTREKGGKTQSKSTSSGLVLGVSGVTKCFKAGLAPDSTSLSFGVGSGKKLSFSRNVDIYLAGVVENYLRKQVFPTALSNLAASKKKTLSVEHFEF